MKPRYEHGTATPYFVFEGKSHRVKLAIRKPLYGPPNSPPTFSVWAISASKHPSSAFTSGRQLYRGQDLLAAWREIVRAIGNPTLSMPAALGKYLPGKTERLRP